MGVTPNYPPQLDPIAIGQRISQLRESHGLTQRVLASQLGLTEATLSNAEGGRVLPRLETLYRLSWLYGAPIDYLVTGQAKSLPPAPVPDSVVRLVEEYLGSSLGARVSHRTAARMRDRTLWAHLQLETVDMESVHTTRCLLEHAELVGQRTREMQQPLLLRHGT